MVLDENFIKEKSFNADFTSFSSAYMYTYCVGYIYKWLNVYGKYIERYLFV